MRWQGRGSETWDAPRGTGSGVGPSQAAGLDTAEHGAAVVVLDPDRRARSALGRHPEGLPPEVGLLTLHFSNLVQIVVHVSSRLWSTPAPRLSSGAAPADWA